MKLNINTKIFAKIRNAYLVVRKLTSCIYTPCNMLRIMFATKLINQLAVHPVNNKNSSFGVKINSAYCDKA